MSFTIRPFEDRDFPALSVIIREVFDQSVSPETLRQDEARRDPKYRLEAWVAEVDGQMVGYGMFNQWAGSYHPRKFALQVAVLPAFRRRGIGGALYARVREALAPTDPIALNADAKETWTDSLGMLERRGFREKMRSWESRLDLSAFDPAAFAPVVDAAGARGYEFCPLSALREEPGLERRLFDLVSVARRDIPSPQPLTELTFEEWRKGLERPHIYPEAYWVAFHGGQMVGLSTIWKTDDPAVLETGVTALLREHRGAGVAKALKVKALSVAKAQGYRTVKTWNATFNAPMLGINGWLGFVRQPAWVAHVLQLHPEE